MICHEHSDARFRFPLFYCSHASSRATRCYRLIDSGCQPHQQLDGQYSSIEEAITEAIAWLEPLDDGLHHSALIGVEVSTSSGDWRTCRLPAPLLCPLPR